MVVKFRLVVTWSSMDCRARSGIRIRMAEQSERMRYLDTADDELAPLDQPVHIVTHAKTRHIYQYILS